MGYTYLITVCLCLCPGFTRLVNAQTTHRFLKELSVEEGLSSNKINDITQDDDGFLWIATNDGLNRFDGTEVKQYYHQDKVNSLPHNYVHCLKRLPGNYIAVGTEGGVSFYDTRRGMFNNFYYKQNSPLDEYNNTIIKLELDKNGNLWAASRNCIFIFDAQRKLKKIINSSFTDVDAARQRLRFIEKFFPLPGGHMLLFLYNGWHISSPPSYNIVRLENSLFKKSLEFLNTTVRGIEHKNEPYFTPANVFKAFSDFFICIQQGKDSLLLYNDNGKRLSSLFFPYNKYPYVFWSQQLVVMDSSRLLLFFHNYGLVEINIHWQNNNPMFSGLSVLMYEAFEYASGLRDHEGNWWLITTRDGLQKLSPHKPVFHSNRLVSQTTGAPVKYEMVSLNRYKNNLWMSTYGDGFFRRDLISGKQEQFRLAATDHYPWPNFIWNVRQVSNDSVWLGTQDGLFWYCISNKKYGRLPPYPGKPAVLDSMPVTTQFTDSRGLTWIGLGRGNGLCRFDPSNRRFKYFPGNSVEGYPLRYPKQIVEDKKGNLWFTNDASKTLVHWNRKTEKFQTVSLPQEWHEKISNLVGIWCENDSIIWLGTESSGLIKFNLFNKETTLYGRDKGIGDSYVSSIYQDSLNRLWLVTRSGLSCFEQQTGNFINYNARNGLPVKYPTALFFYDTLDHCLYTGGSAASICFDPEMIIPPQAPKKTIITSMEVNGKLYLFTDQPAAFKSTQNNITIHYTAVDLTNGSATKYAYKLMGEDTGWVMADKQRQINFSHLAPGDYIFMVRASNNNYSWNTEAASIRFSIAKPFTQTLAFYSLIVLAMVGIFYGMYRFRLTQLARTEKVRSEISKNLHDEVGSTLTNISLSSLLAQKQVNTDGSVSRILERIYHDSQSVSENMREIVWSINPKIDTLGEALPRMLQYASELLEAKDMELVADIDPAIDEVKLNMQKRRDLYLIFKETINNLAKHSGATKVKVSLQLESGTLIMNISDNGVGFDKAVTLRNNGLKNMQERAASHHWDLDIHSVPGEGTTLILKAQVA